jgi:hypothetical protein
MNRDVIRNKNVYYSRPWTPFRHPAAGPPGTQAATGITPQPLADHLSHGGAGAGPAGAGDLRPRLPALGRRLAAPARDHARGVRRELAAAAVRGRGRGTGDRGAGGVAGQRLRVSGPPDLPVGPDAAAGDARLHHRVHLHRHARLHRTGASPDPRSDRARLRAVLVPGDPVTHRGDADADPGAVPLCLPADARRLSGTVGLRPGGLPNSGQRPLRRLLPGGAAAGTPGRDRRAHAGIDGGAGRLRNGGLLRHRDLHHGHLPDLVRSRRPRRRGTAGRRPAQFRLRADSAGTLVAHARTLPSHQFALLQPAALPPDRLEGHGSGGRLPAADPVRFPDPGRTAVDLGSPDHRSVGQPCLRAAGVQQLLPRGAGRGDRRRPGPGPSVRPPDAGRHRDRAGGARGRDGLRGAGDRDRDRRDAALRLVRQRPGCLHAGTVRHLHRAAAVRNPGGAAVRLRGALSRGVAADGRGRAGQGQAEHGRCGPLARHAPAGHADACTPADHARHPAHRAAAGLRGRAEGTARDADPAPLRFQHPRGTRLRTGRGRAPGGILQRGAGDRAGRAASGYPAQPDHRTIPARAAAADATGANRGEPLAVPAGTQAA